MPYLGDAPENGQSQMLCASFLGVYTTHHFRAVFHGLCAMECALRRKVRLNVLVDTCFTSRTQTTSSGIQCTILEWRHLLTGNPLFKMESSNRKARPRVVHDRSNMKGHRTVLPVNPWQMTLVFSLIHTLAPVVDIDLESAGAAGFTARERLRSMTGRSRIAVWISQTKIMNANNRQNFYVLE